MQACARQQLILILKWRTTHCTGVRQKGASYYNLGNCVPDYVTKRAEVTPIVWNLCPSTPCIIVILFGAANSSHFSIEICPYSHQCSRQHIFFRVSGFTTYTLHRAKTPIQRACKSILMTGTTHLLDETKVDDAVKKTVVLGPRVPEVHEGRAL